MKTHQATCVAIAGRGVLIEGPPGSGKSALALALMDRGAQLVGDDGVLLEVVERRLHAQPHPNTRGLLEVRNLGLVAFDVLDSAPIALVIRLDPAAPRFIEAPDSAERMSIMIPTLGIWPDVAPPVLKAELALCRYGLSM